MGLQEARIDELGVGNQGRFGEAFGICEGSGYDQANKKKDEYGNKKDGEMERGEAGAIEQWCTRASG